MSRTRPQLLAAGLAAALAVSALAAPAARAAVAATTRSMASTGGTSTDQSELLINGDRILPLALHQYAVLPAGTGFAFSTIGLDLGSQVYEIPRAAVPYLNHGLDPSLFDAVLLPRTGRLPVTVSYKGPAAPRLPGVTITSARAGTASGYLTPVSARVFGTALADLFNHDRINGTFGTDGMFAAGTVVRLSGISPIPSRKRPIFPMHTVTVRGIGFNGKPASGSEDFMFDLDNLDYFGLTPSALGYFYRGVTKWSLPAGHYVTIAEFGDATGERDVVQGVTVSGSTTVTLDARTATSAVTISTSKPATSRGNGLSFEMSDSAGNGVGVLDGGSPLYVNPMKRSGPGTLRVFADAMLTSPSGVKSPYHYALVFANPANAVLRQQYYTATSANTAIVKSSYYSDVRGAGEVLLTPFMAGDYVGPLGYQFQVPSDQTDYVSTGTPAVYWTTNYYSGTASQANSSHAYLPGSVNTESWNAYPLHNPLDARYADGRDMFPTTLSATRTGDLLSFDITPFGDSTPGHYGSGFNVPSGQGMSGSYELDQNGKKIASGNADRFQYLNRINTFATEAKVTADPAVFRLTLDASRPGQKDPLSSQVTTEWTWRSAHESRIVVPAGWQCPDGTRNCRAEPLMTLDYYVAGLGRNDVAPGGAQVVKIIVGHQQQAASAPTSRVTASFSVDGGKSWQPASMKGSAATWYATFSAPAGSKVTLKVMAADKSGGAISETILNAYAEAGSLASAGYHSACTTPKIKVRCFALYSTQTAMARAIAAGFGASAVSGPAGWGPRDLEKAYRLTVDRKGGTVAVIETFDTPKLESYLNTYRKQYGLPPCTSANRCFRKVNEYGKAAPLPPSAVGTGTGWDLEATLDVDMVSAACPKCHILVVEAQPEAITDLTTANDTAARLGAVAISNSWSGLEDASLMHLNAAFNHPGHAIVASSGDAGFDTANWPADLATVTAVGGTQLSVAHNSRGYSESVWNTPHPSGVPIAGFGGASSSGCSAYIAKPAWQHDPHCPGRTVADVSAVALNLAIYQPDYVKGGWLLVGGTSASSPLVAGIYALAGNATKVHPGYEYAHPHAFFDVAAGNNDWYNAAHGKSCGFDYLCMAKPGYDAPTGLGTPNGIGGF